MSKYKVEFAGIVSDSTYTTVEIEAETEEEAEEAAYELIDTLEWDNGYPDDFELCDITLVSR